MALTYLISSSAAHPDFQDRSLNREAQTLFSPATSTNDSGGIPRLSKDIISSASPGSASDLSWVPLI